MGGVLGILSRCMAFSGLAADDLKTVLSISVERAYPKGALIFQEGDPGDGFYLLLEGKVKVYKASQEGREQILHIIGKGDPFGEAAMYAGIPFPANAQALLDSRCLFFPRAAFTALIASHPSLAMNMLAVLSMRLREFAAQIEGLVLKDVPGRLAAYLLALSAEQGTSFGARLAIPKTQLANLLGTIPETLSRVLGRMQDEGLLAVEKRDIRFLDREGLEELAAGGGRKKRVGCRV
jgi:CRP/FNR family transcriptional regulator